ncbi:hypothetical protein M501DRAFT_1002278, partial [Patellaria atrata CBS 101060]
MFKRIPGDFTVAEVSRQIRREALPIFFKDTMFIFNNGFDLRWFLRYTPSAARHLRVIAIKRLDTHISCL